LRFKATKEASANDDWPIDLNTTVAERLDFMDETIWDLTIDN
jgi:hypothetical protein